MVVFPAPPTPFTPNILSSLCNFVSIGPGTLSNISLLLTKSLNNSLFLEKAVPKNNKCS
jgi:hypothetical protein